MICIKLCKFGRQTTQHCSIQNIRSLSSYLTQRLEYKNYGIPSEVIQHVKEEKSFDLKEGEVLVKFLASPVNPADINTIQVSNTSPKDFKQGKGIIFQILIVNPQ